MQRHYGCIWRWCGPRGAAVDCACCETRRARARRRGRRARATQGGARARAARWQASARRRAARGARRGTGGCGAPWAVRPVSMMTLGGAAAWSWRRRQRCGAGGGGAGPLHGRQRHVGPARPACTLFARPMFCRRHGKEKKQKKRKKEGKKAKNGRIKEEGRRARSSVQEKRKS